MGETIVNIKVDLYFKYLLHGSPTAGFVNRNFLPPADEIKTEISQEDCYLKDYPWDEGIFPLCMKRMAENHLDVQ